MVKLSGTHAQTSNLIFPHDVRGMLVGGLAMLAAGAAWGFANGLLITRLKMPPFIVTLGTFGMTFGAADLLTGGTNLSSVPTRFQDKFGNGTIGGIYIPVLVAGAIVIVAFVVLRMTRFGAYTRAIGSSSGSPPNRSRRTATSRGSRAARSSMRSSRERPAGLPG